MKFSGHAFGSIWRHERELYLFDKDEASLQAWIYSRDQSDLRAPRDPFLARHESQAPWDIFDTASQPSEQRAVLRPPTCAQGQEETCSLNWNEAARCPNTQQLPFRHTTAHEEGVERGNVLSKSTEETHGHTEAQVLPVPPSRLPQILKKKPMAWKTASEEKTSATSGKTPHTIRYR